MIIMFGAVTHTLLGNVQILCYHETRDFFVSASPPVYVGARPRVYPEWMGRGVRNSRIEAGGTCTELNLGNEAIC